MNTLLPQIETIVQEHIKAREKSDNYIAQKVMRWNYLLKGLRMVARALWRSEARRVVPWSETLHEP